MQRGKLSKRGDTKSLGVCYVSRCCNLDRAARKDLTKNVALEFPFGEVRKWELWIPALEEGLPECLGGGPGDQGCCR